MMFSSAGATQHFVAIAAEPLLHFRRIEVTRRRHRHRHRLDGFAAAGAASHTRIVAVTTDAGRGICLAAGEILVVQGFAACGGESAECRRGNPGFGGILRQQCVARSGGDRCGQDQRNNAQGFEVESAHAASLRFEWRGPHSARRSLNAG